MIYDVARAQEALRAQGLDVLANVLTFNFHEFAVEQTGGYCMALVMYYADDSVTVVTGEALDHYTVCRYTLAAWEGGHDVDPSPLTLDTDLNGEEVVALLSTPFDMTTYED